MDGWLGAGRPVELDVAVVAADVSAATGTTPGGSTQTLLEVEAAEAAMAVGQPCAATMA